MPNDRVLNNHLISACGQTVVLPASVQFDGANFSRSHDDLVIIDKNGVRVFIRGFFNQPVYPLIESQDGQQMLGEFAAALVKLSPRAVSALLEIDSNQPDEPRPSGTFI